jgi:hypothetical protein
MSLFLAWRISDRNFADALGEFELTPRQYSVLLSLAADQPLTQTELVNRVGVDRSGMGRQIDGLEQRGLVERRLTRSTGELMPSTSPISGARASRPPTPLFSTRWRRCTASSAKRSCRYSTDS